jgi:hypothetical protein
MRTMPSSPFFSIAPAGQISWQRGRPHWTQVTALWNRTSGAWMGLIRDRLTAP